METMDATTTSGMIHDAQRLGLNHHIDTDVSCDLEPPGISMLRIEVTPSAGGDTTFASMYAALETLSRLMQALLAGCSAVHAGDLPFRGAYKALHPAFSSWNYFPRTRSGWRVTTVGERPCLELPAPPATG